MSDGSHEGDKAGIGSSSSRVTHMGNDQGLLKQMDGLEESIKLIMTTLNIRGVENRRTRNKDVGTARGSTYTKNLVNDSTDVEPYINCNVHGRRGKCGCYDSCESGLEVTKRAQEMESMKSRCCSSSICTKS